MMKGKAIDDWRLRMVRGLFDPARPLDVIGDRPQSAIRNPRSAIRHPLSASFS